jgi:ribosome biogenesis GTPase / thiamine phosphate phosphatase
MLALPSHDLSSLGWDDTVAAAFASVASIGEVPARVARVDRGGLDTLTTGGPVRATPGSDLLAAAAQDPVAAPVTGDWVTLRHWPDGPVTAQAVLPRRSAVVRAVASGASQGQVLAANVDTVLVVASLAVEPDLGRIERFLTLAWDSGAQPVVVLAKADLVRDAVHLRGDVESVAAGAPVLCLSAVTGDGLDALIAHVGPGRTAALLGTSGAGKSTLVNALLGVSLLATKLVRADGKGRHATTAREMVVLPSGGLLIDTPGLRSVGLLDAGEGIERVFTDVEELGRDCRFADCRHQAEPGCAVLAAVEAGTLPQRRLESWHKLGREAANAAARTDARLRAEMRRRWKVVHKSVRQAGVTRP